MSVFSDYKKEIMDAAHNERIRLALSRAIKSYRGNTNEAMKKFPHTDRAGRRSPGDQDERHRARWRTSPSRPASPSSPTRQSLHRQDGRRCSEIIDKLVGTGKLIVKGKSMTGEEIELREHLEASGQRGLRDRPRRVHHPEAGFPADAYPVPGLHVPKEDVAKLFSKITGEKLPPDDIASMVADGPQAAPGEILRRPTSA